MNDKTHMAKIGALGGAAGKGTKLRARLNKRAAKIRWAKRKQIFDRIRETLIQDGAI